MCACAKLIMQYPDLNIMLQGSKMVGVSASSDLFWSPVAQH